MIKRELGQEGRIGPENIARGMELSLYSSLNDREDTSQISVVIAETRNKKHSPYTFSTVINADFMGVARNHQLGFDITRKTSPMDMLRRFPNDSVIRSSPDEMELFSRHARIAHRFVLEKVFPGIQRYEFTKSL